MPEGSCLSSVLGLCTHIYVSDQTQDRQDRRHPAPGVGGLTIELSGDIEGTSGDIEEWVGWVYIYGNCGIGIALPIAELLGG